MRSESFGSGFSTSSTISTSPSFQCGSALPYSLTSSPALPLVPLCQIEQCGAGATFESMPQPPARRQALQALAPEQRKALQALVRGAPIERIAELLCTSIPAAERFARDPFASVGYKGPRYHDGAGV